MANYELGSAPTDYKGDVRKPFALIPEGTWLDAVITEIKEDVKPFNVRDENNVDTGIPVVKLAWTFATRYDDQDRNVWGETGVEFYEHPDCKFYTWTQEGLGGIELVKGFVVDTDHLIGQPVRVMMGERSYTKKGETEKRTVNFVSDVMRARGGLASASAAASAPTHDEEPF